MFKDVADQVLAGESSNEDMDEREEWLKKWEGGEEQTSSNTTLASSIPER